MQVPDSVLRAVEAHTGSAVTRTQSVGGGCIARAHRIDTPSGSFFLKFGGPDVAQTFQAEAEGLNALRKAESPLVVPRVFAAEPSRNGPPGFLLMEWIEPGTGDGDFWDCFGRGLARLHRHTAEQYGFGSTNFIGRLPQRNEWHDAWPNFFRAERLELQVRMARENGRWDKRWDRPLENLYGRLHELLPERPPASVLHGDLWSGNYLVTADGKAALIDPAAYYGHREADLAMTELFGGFSRRFYESYRSEWPLEPGYEIRRELYNLYHLINHMNHFGASYASGVSHILARFGG